MTNINCTPTLQVAKGVIYEYLWGIVSSRCISERSQGGRWEEPVPTPGHELGAGSGPGVGGRRSCSLRGAPAHRLLHQSTYCSLTHRQARSGWQRVAH